MKNISDLEKQQVVIQQQIDRLRDQSEQNEIDTEQFVFEEYKSTLAPKLQKAAEVVWGEMGWDVDAVKDFCEKDYKSNVRFFVNCYWSNGGTQTLEDNEGLLECVYQKIQDDDKSFGISVHSLETGENINLLDILKIEISV